MNIMSIFCLLSAFGWQSISSADNSIFLTEVWSPEQLLVERMIITGLMVYFLMYSSLVCFDITCRDKLQLVTYIASTAKSRDIVIKSIKTVSPTTTNEDLINRFKNLINNNLMTEKFTVAKICKELGISRSGFNKKIKDLTGLPPKKYIMDYKLNKSKELLQEKNVRETAMELNFYDAKTFSKIFKRRFGVSPSEYRKELLNKNQN